MAATESVFMKSANLHKQCELTGEGGTKTIVEPYAIFTSSRGRRCYRCYLVSPAAQPGSSAWINPEIASITAVRMQETAFQTRPEYDPFDKQLFPMVHFSLPTSKGQQRWADAPKARDSSTLKNYGGGF